MQKSERGRGAYVVPVALAGLEHGALKLERALPCAGLGRGLVLGERKLAGVVVPRAEEMDGLDGGGSAKIETELNGGHSDYLMRESRKIEN